ncbi:MAG: PLP-dependent aminotransferase family protein [Xanthomonadales bacterium]|nr:PLP-dependent aminotransferase family protein [Gammaproteobacteria bacterium]MBT8055161.1 PLP-dependent aminotransferase family protein [Gammaproteobacteria bacterium]NND57728.1 PLP-dependent aminotransferase family protein [Xanthomonadales bacterium]NNK52833.1 PLP-dependent aminotransferase family protein [Xanthomonadales bacterium]
MSKKPRTATFDGAPATGIINFGVGQPSEDLLPVGLLRRASADFMAHAQPLELNYGERQGDAGFRHVLADFLTRSYHQDVTADSLFVTGGNSQALDFICGQFAKPGDTVFIEEPSYFLAHQIFADHGLHTVGIPMDENGLIIEVLAEQLALHRPVFLYTIPTYHNPGGQTLSAGRREALTALSIEHDFLIVADEVYQLLHYFDPPPAALGTMTGKGNVLSMGSFSKIMAPGLRLGWIQTSNKLMKQLLETGVINSGGSLNHYTSHVMRHAIKLGLQDSWLQQLRETYRRRVEVMDAALRSKLSGVARWRRPGGGYFFWLEMDGETDTTALRDRAREFQTGFQPGALFSCAGQLHNCLRLSFAHYGEDEIIKGIERLGALMRQ